MDSLRATLEVTLGKIIPEKSYQKAGTESLNMGAFRVLMTEPENRDPGKRRRCTLGLGVACLYQVSKGLS